MTQQQLLSVGKPVYQVAGDNKPVQVPTVKSTVAPATKNVPVAPVTKNTTQSTKKDKPSTSGSSAGKKQGSKSSYDADMKYVQSLAKKGMTPEEMKNSKAVNINNKAYKDYVISKVKQPVVVQEVVTTPTVVPTNGLAAVVAAPVYNNEWSAEPAVYADPSKVSIREQAQVANAGAVGGTDVGFGDRYIRPADMVVMSDTPASDARVAAMVNESGLSAKLAAQDTGRTITADDRAQMQWIQDTLYGGGRNRDQW